MAKAGKAKHSRAGHSASGRSTARVRGSLREDANVETRTGVRRKRIVRAGTAEALRASETRFRELADNISQFAWTADRAGWIYWYNKRWFDYTGTTIEEMEGWGWQKVHHPDHVDRVVHKIRQSFEQGTPWEDTFPLRGRDGDYRWFLSRALPIRDKAGRIIRWFGTNTDVTEQIRAENELSNARDELERKVVERTYELQRTMAELTHMNRVATAGVLSASIAHELSQPLGAILNNAEMAELLLKAPSPNLEQVEEILAEIKRDNHRASEVIKRLRSLLTRAKVISEDVDLNHTVREVLGFLTTQASSRDIILHHALSPHTVLVKGDRIHLQQVILNLVVNGMDAVANVSASSRKITSRTAIMGSAAEVSVADSGPGIRSDKLPHLFEPFFTTKEHGMGIGLSIARTIIEAHGGRIWAENQSGGGAIFRLSLPLANGRQGTRNCPR